MKLLGVVSAALAIVIATASADQNGNPTSVSIHFKGTVAAASDIALSFEATDSASKSSMSVKENKGTIMFADGRVVPIVVVSPGDKEVPKELPYNGKDGYDAPYASFIGVDDRGLLAGHIGVRKGKVFTYETGDTSGSEDYSLLAHPDGPIKRGKSSHSSKNNLDIDRTLSVTTKFALPCPQVDGDSIKIGVDCTGTIGPLKMIAYNGIGCGYCTGKHNPTFVQLDSILYDDKGTVCQAYVFLTDEGLKNVVVTPTCISGSYDPKFINLPASVVIDFGDGSGGN